MYGNGWILHKNGTTMYVRGQLDITSELYVRGPLDIISELYVRGLLDITSTMDNTLCPKKHW